MSPAAITHAGPVTVQMSREAGGRRTGTPAVSRVEIKAAKLSQPVDPSEYETPEILVTGADGSGCLVWLCLSFGTLRPLPARC